ncbi:MAG TPA: T9SS type A sorting domain-containing protein [Bacteroidia bacterium]
MKAKITFLCLLMALISGIKAQTYVTIPDPNFVWYLQSVYPTCMSGNQMDITCPAIQNATTLNVDNISIADLTGAQYFTNLQVLSCNNCNYITSLPSLPSSLLTLSCFGNDITSLPSLPSSLEILDCGNNALTALPPLPTGLKELTFRLNQVTNLPATLPVGLEVLDCGYNLLPNLPTLPESLTYLDCSGNMLTNLPVLPNSIEWLLCRLNQLTSLPTLPDSLLQLYCHGNQLTTLPALPNKLIVIFAYDNALSSLPSLPNALGELQIGNNDLQNLPPLPNSMSVLVCSDNNISCFPTFPNSIVPNGIILTNNPFSCLPNYISGMDATLLSYPICDISDTVNNPAGCSPAMGIMGVIYNDINFDCSLGFSDGRWDNVSVKLFNSADSLLAQTYSITNGYYYFSAPAGTYKIRIDTLDSPLIAGCIAFGIESIVTITSSQPLINNVNFALSCKPGFDIGVQAVSTTGWVFPGQIHNLRVKAGDMTSFNGPHCLANVSGQVNIAVTGPVIFSGVPSGALTPVISAGVFTYNVPNFENVNILEDFALMFTTATTAQAGDLICIDVEVLTGFSGDNNPVNNTSEYCYQIVNSYDPNMKEVFPVGDVAPGFQDWLTYTIHFQNTGNAPAMNIRLADTLDSDFDLETFQVINYSHFNTVSLAGYNLDFNFPNILLADSISDPEGSKGFVQYRIKPNPGLPSGTTIENTASIYFDYNSAIVTNTTVNEFVEPLSTIEKSHSKVSIYPNPGTGKFFVELRENKAGNVYSVEVFNVIGSQVLSVKTANVQNEVDLSAEQNGIYFVKVIGPGGVFTERLIKQ